MIRLKSLLLEQPASDKTKKTTEVKKPNVLFIGDQQTASKYGYAYQLVKSKLVAGNIVGLQDISATKLLRLMRRKIKDTYNVVVIQVDADQIETTDLDSELRFIDEAVSIAKSFNAYTIGIVTPSLDAETETSELVTIYERLKNSLSTDVVIETIPYTKDKSKAGILSANLLRAIQKRVINYINDKFGTVLNTQDAEQTIDADTADTTSLDSIPDLGPVPANAAAFINMWKDAAIAQMKQYGIPASITLAQGGLESGWGKSYLSRKANNYFGIKCHSWSGEKVYAKDDNAKDCFRKYPDAAQSFEDHSKFLVKNGRYSDLFKLKITDYEGWATGLQSAGYATGSDYARKLISIIKSYGLNKYDTGDTSPVGGDTTTSKFNGVLPSVENSKLSFSSRAKKDFEAGIINPNLINDIIEALEIAGVTARIGTAKTGHAKNVKDSTKQSRHMTGTGVDLDEFNGQGNSGGNGKNKGLGGSGGASFMANGDKVIEALKSLGYKWGESGNAKGFIWRSDTGGNHWNHIHVSNTNR